MDPNPGVEDLRAELDPPVVGILHFVADGHVVHADGSTDKDDQP